MKFIEEEFRKIYQQELARREKRTAQCLSAETFERILTGKMDQAGREGVADHLIECSACAREYRALSSLKLQLEQSLSPTPAAPPSQSRERFIWPRWRIVSAIAMIFIAIGTPLTLWLATRPGPVPQPNERGGPSVRLNVYPSDKAMLDDAPQKLEWSAVERAESYKVSLYDFQSTSVWESVSTTDTSITLPETVRASLQSGKPYYWQITIQEGIERRPSDVFQFTISVDARRQ